MRDLKRQLDVVAAIAGMHLGSRGNKSKGGFANIGANFRYYFWLEQLCDRVQTPEIRKVDAASRCLCGRDQGVQHIQLFYVRDFGVARRVVKNSFHNGKNFADLFAHYHEGFGEYIEQTVNELNATLQIK